MIIATPSAHVDIATQITFKTEQVEYNSSSVSFVQRNEDKKTFDFSSYEEQILAGTIINFNKLLLKNYTTWDEEIEGNINIISKFRYKKSYKVKARITTISKFTPIITID